MEYNILKKKEFIFIGGILILALAMWGGMSLINKGSHGSIRITVDGKEYGTYSLEKDQTIKINDTNVCEIKDGQALKRAPRKVKEFIQFMLRTESEKLEQSGNRDIPHCKKRDMEL